MVIGDLFEYLDGFVDLLELELKLLLDEGELGFFGAGLESEFELGFELPVVFEMETRNFLGGEGLDPGFGEEGVGFGVFEEDIFAAGEVGDEIAEIETVELDFENI